MMIVVVLFATVLLRVAVVFTFVYLMLPATRTCPSCGAELVLIRHPVLRRLVPPVRHKWCLGCGWSGIVREPVWARERSQSRVISRAARS